MIHTQDADFTLHVGDVFDILPQLEAGSVHCVVTSPPYWGLRDYGTGQWDGGDPDCDHVQTKPTPHSGLPNAGANSPEAMRATVERLAEQEVVRYRDVCGKCGAHRVDQQLGLEPTPDLYVARMVAVFREVRRVLRDDGTCWVNLGDSYVATQGGRQHAIGELPKGGRAGKPRFDSARDKAPEGTPWAGGNVHGKTVPPASSGLKPKDLVGIPWRVAFALQADGWYLRADVIWAKPNPMPESVTDRPTKAHEYVFLLTKRPRYFFDQEAVREPADSAMEEWRRRNGRLEAQGPKAIEGRATDNGTAARRGLGNPAGRNVRSVWEIATQPYPDAHFATFPEELARRCILAGTSERGVCPECGAPWTRDVEREFVKHQKTLNTNPAAPRGALGNQGDNRAADGHLPGHYDVTTTGWRPSCDCIAAYRDSVLTAVHGTTPVPVPATVLDPFLGSGTTAHVARKHGRRCVGVELNPDYAALAARRLSQLSLLA